MSASPRAGASPTGAAWPGGQPQPASVAERRLVSILFADLVGFTSWSADKDPEEVRELLTRYFDRARIIVERYGGMVEKFIGDAVMAVWGVPATREGDAERAVRAGLELVEMARSLGAAAPTQRSCVSPPSCSSRVTRS